MIDSGIFRFNSGPPPQLPGAAQLPFDADGGLDLRQLPAGTAVEVQTKNNTYTVVTQASGEVFVWGHPEFCPEPILLAGLGACYTSGLFREGYLSPGMRLSFPLQGRRISTSRILALVLKPQQ